MKVKARANSNIALVKYWGKRDVAQNLPAVGSVSITLGELCTETEVEFDAALPADQIDLRDNGNKSSRGDGAQERRISAFLDTVRARSGSKDFARVVTYNNFPTGAGLASSASGFAALALAATRAAGLTLSERELSMLARVGSGSAARSIFGGFARMHKGAADDGSDAFAEGVLDARAWPLTVIVAITSEAKKSIGSTAGMESTRQTSPFYNAFVESSENDIDAALEAIASKDFQKLGEVSEHSCLKMHGLMLSSRPGLLYFNGVTVELIHLVRALRQRGRAAFFTIDAGPQVKVVCLPEDADEVARELKAVPGVVRLIRTGLGEGACVVSST